MDTFFQGLILGLREGLEASLIIVVILQYLNKSKAFGYRKNVYWGITAGITASVAIGAVLFVISSSIDKTGETAKLWESAASFIALILITTFIIWMIKHGRDMVSTVQEKVTLNFSGIGIFLLSAAMVAREGAELAIFSFAGDYNILTLLAGVLIAVILAVLIYFSLIKVNIKVIFNITLVYLILQAGFLVGYGIHEALSAFKDLGIIESGSAIYTKAFDLSDTVLNHKEGAVGLPMYVLLGWYSKPEWVQFAAQYIYTGAILIYWSIFTKKSK